MLVILTGCKTFDNSPVRNYPSDIKAMCEAEINNAKLCIQGKGTSLKTTGHRLEVVKTDGTKKVNGEWLWYCKDVEGVAINSWIYGVCYFSDKKRTYSIIVPCNPQTKGEVSAKTLKHEFGHFWLMSNYNDYTHNTKYKDCFADWRELRTKTLLIQTNDIKIVVDYIE